MSFSTPSWVPDLPLETIPDSVPVSEFILSEAHGRCPLFQSKSPFVCGLSGRQYSMLEVARRVDWLARALAHELDWKPNSGSPWSKLATIFAWNTIDSLPVSWAVHRLSGISSPAPAAYGVSELSYQLRVSKPKVLFTCWSLLDVACKAARNVGIDDQHIYLFGGSESVDVSVPFKTVDHLISQGQQLPALEELMWERGQGARQCAFLNFSSGTTGLPKGVIVSHRNVIANILQLVTYEKPCRKADQQNVVLGVLPQSHIYGLVVVCHISVYRGESVVVLPKMDLRILANAIQQFQINVLFIVPPIVISMISNRFLFDKFDLSSVTEVFTGAAHLDAAICRSLLMQYPSWKIRQAYGLTESATVVSATSPADIILGTCGSLLPGVQARLISLSDGTEISEHNTPGELLIRSPSVTTLGYLDNLQATRDTFGAPGDEWLRTGDRAMFVRNGPRGSSHLVIVDRVKELIKVKGHQVAPAELEACLLEHSLVADAAVIPIADPVAGEVPKAYIVPVGGGKSLSAEQSIRLKREIAEHVKEKKARYKWLKGGVELVDDIPKSPTGKILRRVLRDAEIKKHKDQKASL